MTRPTSLHYLARQARTDRRRLESAIAIVAGRLANTEDADTHRVSVDADTDRLDKLRELAAQLDHLEPIRAELDAARDATEAARRAAAERIVVVPCGGAKLDRPASAGELYTGSYHRMTRAAADALDPDRVLILSGRYGLLELDRIVDPYEQRIDGPGAITVDELRAQADELEATGAAVTVLAGKAYADRISAVWPDAERPLDGTRGMGEQLARLAAIRDHR